MAFQLVDLCKYCIRVPFVASAQINVAPFALAPKEETVQTERINLNTTHEKRVHVPHFNLDVIVEICQW